MGMTDLGEEKDKVQPVAGTEGASSPKRQRLAVRRSSDFRIYHQPGFVLHSRPYSESSLVVEVFTRDHGRVVVLAKGVRRPGSQLRSVLQTFQPLEVSWTGRSEMKTLTAAEWVGGMQPLDNAALFYGFYLNELLLKLLAREDPHQGLYDAYVTALTRLSGMDATQSALRMFELALLKETGVAADLSMDVQNQMPVQPDRTYVVDPEGGPRPAGEWDEAPQVSGKTLLDMMQGDYTDTVTQQQSKQLMRYLLAHHLNGVPLQTRKILMDLREF
ncbi:MAG: DNA repair protein RecO [Oxalobacter sp.]|nr:DNA repair protein RecO [Oxalobacter sp.]